MDAGLLLFSRVSTKHILIQCILFLLSSHNDKQYKRQKLKILYILFMIGLQCVAQGSTEISLKHMNKKQCLVWIPQSFLSFLFVAILN